MYYDQLKIYNVQYSCEVKSRLIHCVVEYVTCYPVDQCNGMLVYLVLHAAIPDTSDTSTIRLDTNSSCGMDQYTDREIGKPIQHGAIYM